MKKIIITIAAVAGLAGLGACGLGERDMTPGTVASRGFEAGHFETKKSKTCVQYKNGTCKRYVTTSRQVWDDAETEIMLTDGRKYEVEGDSIAKPVFDGCAEGRTFHPKTEKCG